MMKCPICGDKIIIEYSKTLYICSKRHVFQKRKLIVTKKCTTCKLTYSRSPYCPFCYK